MWIEVCGSACGFSILLFLCILLYFGIRVDSEKELKNKKLDEEGLVVKARIVIARPELYRRQARDFEERAYIVLIMDRHVPDLDKVLESLAEKVQVFEDANDQDEEEKELKLAAKHLWPFEYPIKLPERLAGPWKAYLATVDIRVKFLPHRRLTLPYVYVVAHIGEDREDRFLRHIPYPKRKKRDVS